MSKPDVERVEKDLKGRVAQYNSLRLPGQPRIGHMGTTYLVNDLWRELAAKDAEVKRLTTEVERLNNRACFKCGGILAIAKYPAPFKPKEPK